ncbi:MAG: hypothetical protein KTR31_28350 [Myxococcales bacterium]|nr:hypothetical protein [Myxococcales bacterium]
MSTPEDEEGAALQALGERFMGALRLKEAADLDRAEEELRAIVRAEPRLAEPHMELARILLDTNRLQEAESHAREARSHLEAGGVWVEEVPDNVVQALSHALLAEILRRRADEDDVLFGDPEQFHAMIRESKEQFGAAAALDAKDEYSSYYAFFLGMEGHGGPPPELAGLAIEPDEDDA